MVDLFVPNNPNRDRALKFGRIRLICSMAQAIYGNHLPWLVEQASEEDCDPERLALDCATRLVDEIDKRFPELADLAE